tara:strand:+ start:5614 stop:6492 length:879 start_codon:yes stop_codon:yes gene_type:complete
MKNIFNAILISLLFISCQSNLEKKSKILKFDITEKKDISYLKNPRMVNRIILDVESLPTDQEMRNTAIYLWENGNKKWEEFTVFIYLPEMNTEFFAFGIGEFNKNGLVKFGRNEDALFDTKWEIKKPEKLVNQIPTAEFKEYKIGIFTNNVEKREMEININTDFPDGTNLLVSIGRTHFLKDIKDAYSGDIFSKDFSVENGKINTTVEINDYEWYNEHIRLVKALPDDIQPIAKISDNITISVLFSPGRTQQENVLEILGTKGEFVGGKGASKFGKLTTFRISKDLNIPFQK